MVWKMTFKAIGILLNSEMINIIYNENYESQYVI